MKFEKVTYHVKIADMLRDMIMIGTLKEGDKVNEGELCETMGISKTPLREALRVLSVEGLIRLVPNRGAFVTQPTFEEIAEMFDVMSLLEGFCARAACEKMTSKDFSRLAKLHTKLEETFERHDQEGYIRINNQFHSFVREITGNRTLNQIDDGLRKKILLYRFQSLNLPGRFECSIREHRDLLEAFRQRDASRAETLMREHLQNQSQALGTLVEQSKAAS
ncbi:MAG: GntR family transcriptional regulator [Deltaproteobacteria bacterium]|nr:GntR family transcriptional regulator [Deltaproteobacteria bacterium]